MAAYFAAPEKYKEWNDSGALNKNIPENIDTTDVRQMKLVEMKNGGFSINDFIVWHRNRSLYIHLNDNDINSFSSSLENMIWQMIRDRLLAARAKERGLDKVASVMKQNAWWKDKITSSMVKNEIKNSIEINIKEIKLKDDTAKGRQQEYNALLLRKIQLLKKKYDIKIDDKALESIPVSAENDSQAIDFYTVKRGGLIPRTPYPTIDYEWINWE